MAKCCERRHCYKHEVISFSVKLTSSDKTESHRYDVKMNAFTHHDVHTNHTPNATLISLFIFCRLIVVHLPIQTRGVPFSLDYASDISFHRLMTPKSDIFFCKFERFAFFETFILMIRFWMEFRNSERWKRMSVRPIGFETAWNGRREVSAGCNSFTSIRSTIEQALYLQASLIAQLNKLTSTRLFWFILRARDPS